MSEDAITCIYTEHGSFCANNLSSCLLYVLCTWCLHDIYWSILIWFFRCIRKAERVNNGKIGRCLDWGCGFGSWVSRGRSGWFFITCALTTFMQSLLSLVAEVVMRIQMLYSCKPSCRESWYRHNLWGTLILFVPSSCYIALMLFQIGKVSSYLSIFLLLGLCRKIISLVEICFWALFGWWEG